MTNSQGKKVTIATIKTFIKREQHNLYIKNESSFDGQYDCERESRNQAFKKVALIPEDIQNKFNTDKQNRLGVPGAWFVGSSRDYFQPYADDQFIGYSVSNCCGSFILAFHR